MIYEFTALVAKPKKMYLTCKDKNELYHRCLNQYRLTKEQIRIDSEVDEDLADINIKKNKSNPNRNVVIVSKSGEVKVDSPERKQVDNEAKAKEIMKGNVYSLNEKELMDKRLKGWEVKKLTSVKKELTELLSKYDRVKLYYEASYARKEKKYIALCK